MMTLTPTNSLLCRRTLWPRRQTFSAWPPAIYVFSPTIGILVPNHWFVGLQPRVSCDQSIGVLAGNIGFLCHKHWPLGPKPLIPWTSTVRLLLGTRVHVGGGNVPVYRVYCSRRELKGQCNLRPPPPNSVSQIFGTPNYV